MLVFFALDYDGGAQLPDERFRAVAQDESMVDPADRRHPFHAHVFGELGVRRNRVAEHADREKVAAFRGEPEQSQMARVDDIEIPRDENGPPARAAFGSYRLDGR